MRHLRKCAGVAIGQSTFGKACKFAVEALERRVMLSAGDVDLKVFSPDAGGPNQWGVKNFVSVAGTATGKIVALSGDEAGGKSGTGTVIQYNADGSYDPSFWFNFIPWDNRFVNQKAVVSTMVIQGDGKILFGGYLQDLTSSTGASAFLLGRFNTDGRPDSAFGTDGMVITDFPGNEQVTALAVDGAGNIYAEGPSFNYPNIGFDVARYSPAGVLVNSYAASLGNNGGQSGPGAMALAPGGQVLVGGATGSSPAVWRLSGALALDASFGSGGVAMVGLPVGDSGAVAGINFTADGHVVTAGTLYEPAGQYGRNPYFLSRLNSNGSVDATFGSSGVAIAAVNSTASRFPLAGLVTESDGKLLIAGTESKPGQSDVQLVLRRYLPDGTVDATFHADQDPNLLGNGSGMVANALSLDNFGRALVSGSVPGGTGFARYTTDVTPPGVSANFGGKPIPVPNYWIETEDFDRGGEGVGYHDTSAQNTGGAYRPNEGVDIGFDSGQAQYATVTNNYVVQDTQPGEWLQYTISVATPALYHLRAATKDYWTGGRFHAEIDGVNVTGDMIVYQSYDGSYSLSSVSKAFYLNAGVHVMRVVMDKAAATGTVGRFDRFLVDEGGSGTVKGGIFVSTPFYIPNDTIEAEDFRFGDYSDTTPQNLGGQYRPFESVDINAGGSNGYSVGYAMKGEYIDYLINSPTNSVYQLQARVACFRPGGTFHVEIDYKDVTGPMTVPDTGPWDTWTTITSKAFAVSPDTHLMRVVMDKGGFWEDVVGDFDYFKFVKTDGVAPPVVYAPMYARDINGTIEAVGYDVPLDTNGAYHNGEGVVYHDTTPENLGQQGQGRWEDAVDIISTIDPHVPAYTWDHAVGYTAPGEWMRYTVNVPATGTYAMKATVANLGLGGTFHFEFDGVDKTGPITVPDTGGYFNWQTVMSKFFDLTAGTHVMRVVMDTAGPGGNIGNFWTYQSTPRLANVVTLDSNYPAVTLKRDPDGVHVDWNNTSSDHGFFLADDPAGLTVNSSVPYAELYLDYSNGDPLPALLRVNGVVSIFGMDGAGLAGSTIDLLSGTVKFHYNYLSPLPISFRQALVAGYDGGRWDGKPTGLAGAIRSSGVAPGSGYSLGYVDGSDGVVENVAYNVFQVKLTLAGDANLDGVVNSADALLMSRNYMKANTSWDLGNFNYDLTTDMSDAKLLQGNWGKVVG